jgi:hypothetical protein
VPASDSGGYRRQVDPARDTQAGVPQAGAIEGCPRSAGASRSCAKNKKKKFYKTNI